jgi:hypothetical protein
MINIVVCEDSAHTKLFPFLNRQCFAGSLPPFTGFDAGSAGRLSNALFSGMVYSAVRSMNAKHRASNEYCIVLPTYSPEVDALSGAISQALRQHYANVVGHLLAAHERRVSQGSTVPESMAGAGAGSEHDECVVPSPSAMEQEPGSYGLHIECVDEKRTSK